MGQHLRPEKEDFSAGSPGVVQSWRRETAPEALSVWPMCALMYIILGRAVSVL